MRRARRTRSPRLTLEGTAAHASGDDLHRNLVRFSSDGIVVIDGSGIIREWNPAEECITGIPASEAVGRPIWELQYRVAPEELRTAESATAIRDRVRAAQGEGLALDWRLVEEIQRPDGARRTIESALFALRGGAEVHVVAISRDITDRKRLEDQKRTSEERLMLALAASNQGLWDWNLAADTAYLSPEYLLMIGETESNISAAGTWFQSVIHPEDLPAVQREMGEHLAGRTPRSIIEYRMRRRSGDYVWLHGIGRVTRRSPEGAPLRMTGVVVDISERKRLESELRSAIKARDSLLAAVTHDLRTPLSTINLIATAMLRRFPQAGESKERQKLELIASSAIHMNRLIGDLLDAATIDAGTFTIRKSEQELGPILEEAARMLGPLARARSVRIELDVEPAVAPLEVDRPRLLQVLANLLGNAVKFANEGGRVVVSVRTLQQDVSIAVVDDGPGIPEEQLPRLFDRFWKDAERERVGFGLGLFIAKTIVEAHGGRLGVESTPGAGTTFRFTLPSR